MHCFRFSLFLLGVLALACQAWLPQRAWAQRTLILPPREIAEAAAAKQLHDAQFDALLDDYRRQLRLEWRFVARACELTAEQVAALEAHNGEILDRIEQAMFEVLHDHRAAPWRSIVESQWVKVANGSSVVFRGAAQVSIREEVDAAVRRTLPMRLEMKLADERQRVAEKVKQAKVRGLAAAMDEVLLLADTQREQLRRLLDSLWEEQWDAVVTAGGLTAHSPEMDASAFVRAKLRGLGGAFDLPDSSLEPVLRPAQLAAWRELRKPRNQDVQLQWVRAVQRRPQFVVGVHGDARVRGVVMPKDGVARLPPQRAAAALKGKARSGAGAQDATAVAIPAEKKVCVDLILDALEQTCSPPPGDYEKLLWAARLDLHHDSLRAAELWQELQKQSPPAEQDRAVRELVRILVPEDALPGADSLLRKAIDSRLSAEQLQRWNEYLHLRGEFQRQSQLQYRVYCFSQRATLTAAQWDALFELFNDRLSEMLENDSPDRVEVEIAIAQTPDDALRGLFDDDQWAAISGSMQEIRQAVPLRAPAIGKQP